MDEDGQDMEFSEDELKALISKFEEMLVKNEELFYDSSEFELIINHYFEANDIKKAYRAINMAKTQYPFAPVFHIRHAQILAASGKHERALEIIEKIEEFEEKNSEVMITKGSIYSQKGDFDKAIECFNRAIDFADKEDHDFIYLNIAYEYINKSQPAKATEFLKKCLEENPSNEIALYELAFCYELTAQHQEAVEYYQHFLEENPFSPVAWFNLGISFSNLHLLEKAVEAYDFAIAIDPSFASAYFNKANALANSSKYKEAIEEYKKTFDLETAESITHYYIGECYEKLEELDKATYHYTLSIKLDEGFPDPYIGMAVVLEFQGRLLEAINFAQKGVNLEPNNSDFIYILAEMQHRHGLLEEAQSNYEKVFELDPTNEDVWLDYTEVLFDQDYREEAITVLKEAIIVFAKNVEYKYRLVAYLYKIGHIKEAFEQLENALTLDFEKHNSLFDYFPPLKESKTVIGIIDNYRNKKP